MLLLFKTLLRFRAPAVDEVVEAAADPPADGSIGCPVGESP